MLEVMRAQMLEGGGSSTDGTPAPRVTGSQTTRMAAPNSSGTSTPKTRLSASPARSALVSRSTNSQANTQAAASASQYAAGAGGARLSSASSSAMVPNAERLPSTHSDSGARKRQAETVPRARKSATSGGVAGCSGTSAASRPSRLRPQAA